MSRFDDLVACGYVRTDPDGTITFANERMAEMAGVRSESLVGRRRFVELLTPGDQIFHDTHFRPILLVDGRVDEVALELRVDSGERVPVLINAVLERDEGGAPSSVHIAVSTPPNGATTSTSSSRPSERPRRVNAALPHWPAPCRRR